MGSWNRRGTPTRPGAALAFWSTRSRSGLGHPTPDGAVPRFGSICSASHRLAWLGRRDGFAGPTSGYPGTLATRGAPWPKHGPEPRTNEWKLLAPAGAAERALPSPVWPRSTAYPPARRLPSFDSTTTRAAETLGSVVMSCSSTAWCRHTAGSRGTRAVRGHEKVPTGGQVEVPAGGQLEVPTLRSSCRAEPVRPCAVTVAVPTSHRHRAGDSIEEREGTDGRHCRLPRGGHATGERPRSAARRTRRSSGSSSGTRSAAAAAPVERVPRGQNYDAVADLVAERVKKTAGRISAKRLLPAARAAGYEGSAAELPPAGRGGEAAVAAGQHHRGRRPAVWSPGETLVIDWGVQGGLHVFCAVLAWSRFRFVRFAADEQAGHHAGACWRSASRSSAGCPKVVLADRMGCLKGGVVANVVVPTADYVRFATHYGFRPGLLRGRRPGVEGDRGEPGRLCQDRPDGPARARRRPVDGSGLGLAGPTRAAAAWCAEVNARDALARSARSRRAAGHRAGAAGGAAVAAARASGRSRSPARSTSCPASGSARPATRCRTG